MYVPSELLNQVEKQAKAEFGDQITYFEWWHEDEFTTIMVQIRSMALDMLVDDRISEIIDSLIGDQYIVELSVSPIESVDATDGLFNLTFHGGVNSFFVDYYPPERAERTRFQIPIHYLKMFKGVRTIRFDSACELWKGLIHPALPKLAKQEGVNSFSKQLLAEDLRDFLLQHLDFIKHIAEARKKPFHLFEPPLESSNGSLQKQSQTRPIAHEVKVPQALPVPVPVPA
ncbi:MAG: hypothetical protein ACPGWR_24170 [Ardenticatenaceae bacterium]